VEGVYHTQTATKASMVAAGSLGRSPPLSPPPPNARTLRLREHPLATAGLRSRLLLRTPGQDCVRGRYLKILQPIVQDKKAVVHPRYSTPRPKYSTPR
jgi:hypothetical protein